MTTAKAELKPFTTHEKFYLIITGGFGFHFKEQPLVILYGIKFHFFCPSLDLKRAKLTFPNLLCNYCCKSPIFTNFHTQNCQNVLEICNQSYSPWAFFLLINLHVFCLLFTRQE
ncbi:hypothetical protein FKM82_002171 [Ascaphus truei]